MKGMEVKNFNSPEEVRRFEKGILELVTVGGVVVGRGTFQPGWRWSEYVKTLANTEWCEASHFQYQISGILHFVMSDGTEGDTKPGDVVSLAAGHDAWVVGNKQVVIVDFQGMADYAKPESK